MKNKVIIMLIIILGVFVGGCSTQDEKAFEVPFKGDMDDIHGMGYAGNDDRSEERRVGKECRGRTAPDRLRTRVRRVVELRAGRHMPELSSDAERSAG